MTRNWVDVSIEIANMEYGMDVPILFLKINMICNLRKNATDKKRSKPMWSKLMR